MTSHLFYHPYLNELMIQWEESEMRVGMEDIIIDRYAPSGWVYIGIFD